MNRVSGEKFSPKNPRGDEFCETNQRQTRARNISCRCVLLFWIIITARARARARLSDRNKSGPLLIIRFLASNRDELFLYLL